MNPSTESSRLGQTSGRVDVALVGPYPPPPGGISVHVQRLRTLLSDRWDTRVIDLYASHGDRPAAFVEACGSDRPWNVIRARRALKRLRPALVHFHVSAMNRFLIGGPLLMQATAGAHRLLTIHSGSFVDQMLRTGRYRARWVRGLIREMDGVVVVNERQRALLASWGIPAGRLHVIPAYLPPRVEPDPELRRRLDTLPNDRPRLCISGYGLRYYGFHVLAEALEGMPPEQRPVVYCALYNDVDEDYIADVTDRFRALIPTVVVRDLSPGAFAYLLSRADLFVRATDRDGDAVSIREAGRLGVRVLASDCTSRPEGALLFETMNPTDLRRALQAALADPDLGRLVEQISTGERLFALYADLLSAPA